MVRETPIRLMLAALVVAVAAGDVPLARAQGQDAAQAARRDEQPTSMLKAERNLVVVRVVVRDAKGNAVGNLRKEDFQLFDNGQPQTVSQFALESSPPKPATRSGAEGQAAGAQARSEPARALSTSLRYLALYFDDVHMPFEEIVYSRDAAVRNLESALQPDDRAGIFTSSGQQQLDFTDDRTKLREALAQLRPTPTVGPSLDRCNDISDYEAYLIVQQHNEAALDMATEEFFRCHGEGEPAALAARSLVVRDRTQAQLDAEAAALRVLNATETESTQALRGIRTLARRMASLPGQRKMVLISSGFITETLYFQVQEIIDRALRSNLVISALDARGLFVIFPGGGDRKNLFISPSSAGSTDPSPTQGADSSGQATYRGNPIALKTQYELARQRLATRAMESLAEATGGSFFSNSNDLDEGFRRISGLPEKYYVLAFSPRNLKTDGSFHTLKVRLASRAGLSLQARRGYFAPRQPLDAATQEEQILQEASISQDEVNDFPLEVYTQSFKAPETGTQLSVLARVDARQLQFRKEEGVNVNHLTFVAVLFDRDGKYVAGQKKAVEFRLPDASLEKLEQSGITLETKFDVTPGTYLIREVVREGESGQMSALSRTVEIPD